MPNERSHEKLILILAGFFFIVLSAFGGWMLGHSTSSLIACDTRATTSVAAFGGSEASTSMITEVDRSGVPPLSPSLSPCGSIVNTPMEQGQEMDQGFIKPTDESRKGILTYEKTIKIDLRGNYPQMIPMSLALPATSSRVAKGEKIVLSYDYPNELSSYVVGPLYKGCTYPKELYREVYLYNSKTGELDGTVFHDELPIPGKHETVWDTALPMTVNGGLDYTDEPIPGGVYRLIMVARQPQQHDCHEKERPIDTAPDGDGTRSALDYFLEGNITPVMGIGYTREFTLY